MQTRTKKQNIKILFNLKKLIKKKKKKKMVEKQVRCAHIL